MISKLTTTAWLVFWFATPVFAHRVDEYLQAAMFTVERDHLAVTLRLHPGVEVLGKILIAIDSNADGVISEAEQKSYAEQVRRALSLEINGGAIPLRLLDFAYPSLEEMQQGTGEIVLSFETQVPSGDPARKLVFENHHLPALSVYLANCFVPSDPSIRVLAQDRNYEQSRYSLDYRQDSITSSVTSAAMGSFPTSWTERTGSKSLFRAFLVLGLRHILTGYDHLLFVGALALAATSLWELIKVVSAFTLAHTVTLTLAALNWIHLSGSIVEPLIAASIVFVAIQNVLFPRQTQGWSRLGAAFFFGLFHGLGFAGGFLDAMHDMESGTMFLAILAFSVGIEAGHQMVILPLFTFLKAVRPTQPNIVTQTQNAFTFQRIGSAGISVAGIYYLCVALSGSL
jgi:hydrogenase/urease accessory protein HupE